MQNFVQTDATASALQRVIFPQSELGDTASIAIGNNGDSFNQSAFALPSAD
jgi:hypothetical protein